MKIFIGTILIILTIACLIGAGLIYKKGGMPDVSNEPKRALMLLGIIVLGVAFGLTASVILGAFDSSPSEEREKEKIRQEIEACNQLTNMYQKCSWSALESRCVCKQR